MVRLTPHKLFRALRPSLKLLNMKPPIRAKSAPYGTWALTRLTHLNAGRIQPVLDVDNVIANLSELETVIEKRQMEAKPDLTKVATLFTLAKQLREDRKLAEKRRDENSVKVQTLLKSVKDSSLNTADVKGLREAGKVLREELRAVNQRFNDVNDELVDLILSLPNVLDPLTPVEGSEIIKEVAPPPGVDHWKHPRNLRWDRVPASGPYADFPFGNAVWLELELASKCQKFLLEHGFCETGNVDFVKRILLEGSGLDPDQFLRVRESKVKAAGVAHASYLVGGASFPAFLALFAQSIIQNEDVLPIRYFVVGRLYSKRLDGPGTIQSSAVQAFVACRHEEEQEAEYQHLASLMEKFYSERVGLTFQAQLLPAPSLQTYETKKLSFLAPERNKVIGDLATVGDYVSKRLLCCYMDLNRAPKFMSLITGQFMNITDFLRPPALLKDPTQANFKTDGPPPAAPLTLAKVTELPPDDCDKK